MASTESLRLGWIGLGSMGLAMATNLQKHQQEKNMPAIKYWNRTISRGDPLSKIGGIASESIEELVQACDVIFISVSNDEALTSVISHVLASGPIASKILVDTTTIHPNTSTSISTLLHPTSASYIAAPVFGATPLALAGTLLIALAGPPPAIQSIAPFLPALSRATHPSGPTPTTARRLKTTSNYLTAGLMLLLSEAHTLAATAGLPAPVLESLVDQNFGPYAHAVSKRLTSGAYLPALGTQPLSGLELGIKDVGHGVRLAAEKGMRLRVGELYLEAAAEAGQWGAQRERKLDSSSVFGAVRTRAGLEFETEVVRERDGDSGGGEEETETKNKD